MRVGGRKAGSVAEGETQEQCFQSSSSGKDGGEGRCRLLSPKSDCRAGGEGLLREVGARLLAAKDRY